MLGFRGRVALGSAALAFVTHLPTIELFRGAPVFSHLCAFASCLKLLFTSKHILVHFY